MRESTRRDLRKFTAQLHVRTEDLVGLSADLTTDEGYARFLRMMATAYQRFGGALDASSRAAGLDPRSTELRRALSADISELGGTAPDERLSESGDATTHHEAWLCGVGYTLEGSAMGARHLLQTVARDDAVRYLRAMLDDRRDRWPHYSRWIDEQCFDGDELATAVAGASAVFDAIALEARMETNR